MTRGARASRVWLHAAARRLSAVAARLRRRFSRGGADGSLQSKKEASEATLVARPNSFRGGIVATRGSCAARCPAASALTRASAHVLTPPLAWRRPFRLRPTFACPPRVVRPAHGGAFLRRGPRAPAGQGGERRRAVEQVGVLQVPGRRDSGRRRRWPTSLPAAPRSRLRPRRRSSPAAGASAARAHERVEVVGSATACVAVLSAERERSSSAEPGAVPSDGTPVGSVHIGNLGDAGAMIAREAWTQTLLPAARTPHHPQHNTLGGSGAPRATDVRRKSSR